MKTQPGWGRKLKTLVIGGDRSLKDQGLFHKLSLAAFFAWVGLGADGLSSSCYGPEEAFLYLQGHETLALIVALAAAATIWIISACYCQIIDLFPSGGGGYLVASKLHGPKAGLVSGCALMIDYVLTITISIAGGASAVFSFLPPDWQSWRLAFAIVCILLLILLNLRGIRESVALLVPVFLLFVVTHIVVILYALLTHVGDSGTLLTHTGDELRNSTGELGLIGVILLILRAYSMGAGTFTGIEAVSNGLLTLREPRARTGKRTMKYMAFSLALTVVGLMTAYLLYGVSHQEGKTLNAVLFESMTRTWPQPWGTLFVWTTLISEAALLLIAAQAGFIDGPRVLANMAVDRWMPTRFSTLSGRLVTQNGILLMGGCALVVMFLTQGSLTLLVVLYSINVFITFTLSLSGMVKHWWQVRHQDRTWKKNITLCLVGTVLTSFILISLVVFKFHEGGWITLAVTSLLVFLAIIIHRHYRHVGQLLTRLEPIVAACESAAAHVLPAPEPQPDPEGKTAVILVNGFNGLGLHTLLHVQKLFDQSFKNFVFVQVGQVDAGNFKGAEEMTRLEDHVKSHLNRYVDLMRKQGRYASSFFSIGVDLVEEISGLVPQIAAQYKNTVFFAGQIVFPQESVLTRWLHNYAVFEIQRRLYSQGHPFLIMPVRVYE